MKLKSFNIEDAKLGYLVVTQKGEPVRILCYDNEGDYPVVALINGKPELFNEKGEQCKDDDLLDLRPTTTLLIVEPAPELDEFQLELKAVLDATLSAKNPDTTEIAYGESKRLREVITKDFPKWKKVVTKNPPLSDDDDSLGYIINSGNRCISKDGWHFGWTYSPGDLIIAGKDLEKLPIE